MARKQTEAEDQPQRRKAPARSLEGREQQLVNLAVNLAEKQLIAGTASAQVISHYLQLGSTKNQLELERIRLENELTKAKAEALKDAKKIQETFEEALKAMRSYSGSSSNE